MIKQILHLSAILAAIVVLAAVVYWAVTASTYESRHSRGVQCTDGYVLAWISDDRFCIPGYRP